MPGTGEGTSKVGFLRNHQRENLCQMGVPVRARIIGFADFVKCSRGVEMPNMHDLIQGADVGLEIPDQMIVHARILGCKATVLIVLPVLGRLAGVQRVIANFEDHRRAFQKFDAGPGNRPAHRE